MDKNESTYLIKFLYLLFYMLQIVFNIFCIIFLIIVLQNIFTQLFNIKIIREKFSIGGQDMNNEDDDDDDEDNDEDDKDDDEDDDEDNEDEDNDEDDKDDDEDEDNDEDDKDDDGDRDGDRNRNGNKNIEEIFDTTNIQNIDNVNMDLRDLYTNLCPLDYHLNMIKLKDMTTKVNNYPGYIDDVFIDITRQLKSDIPLPMSADFLK